MGTVARAVLGQYPIQARADSLQALGNRGGFSGASLWRVKSRGGDLCLRAWPAGTLVPERLQEIHFLMRLACDGGLAFIPTVLASSGGARWVEHAGRLWDLTTWMPGRADFHDRPTPARIEGACAALARLHTTWARHVSMAGPCPAVHRRLKAYRDWLALMTTGWLPDRAEPGTDFIPFDRPSVLTRTQNDPVRPWAERAWKCLQTRIEAVPHTLAGWAVRSFPLQPCLCDVWHDHILFEGDVVTGLIDFGSCKLDHVAVDLARLLGSMVGDDGELRNIGLRAYARGRPLSLEEEALVRVLDETGTVLGLANWLTWLYHEGKVFDNRDAVALRLAELVRRVESWRL